MEEHKIILSHITILKQILDDINSAKKFSDINTKLLESTAMHLMDANSHHQREEEVLFPEIELCGIVEPPRIISEEHIELKARKKELLALIKNKTRFSDFTVKIKGVIDAIVSEFPNHIYKEDNILYPMALEIIPQEEWQKIKKKFDEIGYCYFTPKN